MFDWPFYRTRKKDELEGDVFDVLGSLGDFNIFKETIMAFKQVKRVTFF